MTKPVSSTDYYKPDEYFVKYYPAAQSQFIQYEDNGLDSKSLSEGKYELITYKGSKEKLKTTIEISKSGSWEGMPSSRSMHLQIRMKTWPSKVIVNGTAVKVAHETGKTYPGKTSCTYDYKWLRINFIWDGKPVIIEVTDKK